MSAKKNNHKKRVILIGMGTTMTGVLGYFGFQWWRAKRARKQENKATEVNQTSLPVNTGTKSLPPTGGGSTRSDAFPLKRGSKGAKVKSLQSAMIARYGKFVLPRYGADGDFGSETAAAIKKLGLPDSIDEKTYNTLVKGLGSIFGLGRLFSAQKIITKNPTTVYPEDAEEGETIPSRVVLGILSHEDEDWVWFYPMKCERLLRVSKTDVQPFTK